MAKRPPNRLNSTGIARRAARWFPGLRSGLAYLGSALLVLALGFQPAPLAAQPVESAQSSPLAPDPAIPVAVPSDRYSGLLARSPFVMYKTEAPQVVESNFGQNYTLVSLMRLGDVNSAVLLDKTSQQYISVSSTAPEKGTRIQIESVATPQGASLQQSVILRRDQERATVQLEAAGIPVAPPLKSFHSPDAVESRALRRREVESHFIPLDPQVMLHDGPVRPRFPAAPPFTEALALFQFADGETLPL